MRTLFVKMFLWFWVASTLSGLVSFMLGMNLRFLPQHHSGAEQQEHLLRHARPVIQAMSLYGGITAAGLEKGEAVAPLRSGDITAHLFTIQGVPLTVGPSGELAEAARIFASNGAPAAAPYVTRSERAELVAVRVSAPGGTPYIAAGIMVLPPPHKQSFEWSLPPDIWMRVAVSIVIIGLACYVLAWWMASPIRQLRATAQKLADGDLSARVNLNIISGKNDELIDLGRDFNQMAERIEKLITTHKQLVRDISHELRSPLARLSVALGLARQENVNRTQTALDRIELETERLNFLISDLLILSLLEGGGDSLVKAPFSLCELVEEVVADADFEAASKNRQVLLFQCEATTLMGNRELLRRALENIMRNGIRYTEEGTSVDVSLGHCSSGEAQLKVRDHGPGVPESSLSNIFQPFYRVAEDRDRHSGGAGIGLAIAEQTVRLSGGSIRARNMPDGGLELEMRLPLV